ncbi:MAG TPA: TetR/AcrR family transcriptional regulator [Sorangium sp.]|nr:TetR/AcrR family transcriptional regulator [Sorangium sp.]
MSSDADNARFAPAVMPERRPGKAGSTRANNRAERTQALCTAGLQVFLERGLAASTVDEITRAAGVSKGSFYRYFSNKGDLVAAIFAPLEALFNDAMARCERALEQARTPQQLHGAYTQLATELATQLLQTPDPVRLYLQECRGPREGPHAPIVGLANSITAAAIRITETACARQLLRPLPPEITALSVVGACERILMRYFDDSAPSLDPLLASSSLISLVVDGIRA